MYGAGKIRNIAFVGVMDPGYRAFCAEQRLQHMHLRDGKAERTFTDLLSAQLEAAVRSWLPGSDKRILTWQYLCRDNRYRRFYKELDFVIEQEEALILGELKVSASVHASTRAHHQLLDSYSIMRRTGKPVVLCFIWVNLGFGRVYYPMGSFDPEFSKVKFSVQKANGHVFSFLQLRPQELFEWALSQNLVSHSDLLDHALQESRLHHCQALLKQQLRQSNTPYSEWPEELRPRAQYADNKLALFGPPAAETLMGYRLKKALGLDPADTSLSSEGIL